MTNNDFDNSSDNNFEFGLNTMEPTAIVDTSKNKFSQQLSGDWNERVMKQSIADNNSNETLIDNANDTELNFDNDFDTEYQPFLMNSNQLNSNSMNSTNFNHIPSEWLTEPPILLHKISNTDDSNVNSTFKLNQNSQNGSNEVSVETINELLVTIDEDYNKIRNKLQTLVKTLEIKQNTLQ